MAAAGFDEHYEIRSGDYDLDGDTDIYLHHRPNFVFVDVGGVLAPIATDRPEVGEFVLENTGGGFSIDSSPSEQELSAARQLPLSTSLSLVIDDTNYDGAADALVGNMEGEVPGALDQFVFSSVVDGNVPHTVTGLDQERTDFFEATIRWHDDPTYFDRTLTVGARVPFAGAESGSPLLPQMLSDCQAYWGVCETYNGLLTAYFGGWTECFAAVWAQGIDADVACNLNGVHILGILSQELVIKDFSGFSREVAQFVAAGEGIGGWGIEDAADVLETILGVVIGGIGAAEKDPDDVNVDQAEEERAYEVMRVVRNVMAAIENGVYRSDVVYVTLRRPITSDTWPVAKRAMHLALEYRPPGSATVIPRAETISAVAIGLSGDGYLNSKPDYPLERNNRKIGVLTSSVYPSAASLWAALRGLDSNYVNYTNYGLKYAFFPWQIDDGYRNSNGFVHGISDAVFGAETLEFGHFPAVTSFEDLYLGEHAVQADKFDQAPN